MTCPGALGVSGWMFIYFWVIPTLDHIKDRLDADTAEKLALVDEIKRRHQRLRGLLDYKENQI